AVRTERGGHLRDLHSFERRLDDHLGGEFHAGGPKVHTLECVNGIAADTAVEIARGTAEEQPPDVRQYGIADVPVFPGHRAGLDAAGESIAHDQVESLAELFDKWHQV